VEALTWFVLVLFALATLALAVYGLHLYVLLWLFVRRWRAVGERQRETIARYQRDRDDNDWPAVVTQIPIYNEPDVCVRVIEAAAAMDYPRGRHLVQVLDDSTDASRRVIDGTIERLRSGGAAVDLVRRGDRTAYKAGALANGLQSVTAPYVAIFDADFVPPRDFLRRAIPLLESDSGLACLQGRWGHLNRGESWMTEAQALGIDAHFAIEQGARAWNGLMMNFNGTAGVWRRAAIEDPQVGGWSGDTLTEDLDLSYRAQLAGWRLDYCVDLACPAELPGTVTAFKSQQRRWATGSTQVARKLLPRIWGSDRRLAEKLEATLHLTHYSVSVWMLILAIIARPMLLIYVEERVFTAVFWLAWAVVLISAVAPSLVYTYARHSIGGGYSALRQIPRMVMLGCGMSANNAAAVVSGLLRRGGEFVRTPKSGSVSRPAGRGSTRPRTGSYTAAPNLLWVIELAMGLYCTVTLAAYAMTHAGIVSVFLLMYAAGFLTVGWMSAPWSASGPPSDLCVPRSNLDAAANGRASAFIADATA